MKKLIFLLVLLAALSACKEGQLLENMPPETRIFLDSIKLSGEDRLNSVINLHWSGEDQDGYVQGYELSFDGNTWDFVTTQDSVFRFSFTEGSDTSDIDFWVRALDNQDTRDPSPAYLRVPIRNTPPVAKLDTILQIPDTVFSVFSSLWKVEDLDGLLTIDSVFIRLNDGAWLPLSRNVNFVTLVPSDPETSGFQDALVYTGTETLLLPTKLGRLQVGGMNRFYLQARDIAGSFSEIDSSGEFYVRRKGYDLLMIDDHAREEADTLYSQILLQVYSGYDYLDLRENLPPFWNPTFGLMVKLYDKVFWYSDGKPFPLSTSPLLLENGANQLQLYLNEGGKVLVTLAFPNSFNDPDAAGSSPIFGFSPIDSLSSSSGQARIVDPDNLVEPVLPLGDGYPTLSSPAPIAGADPFYSKNPTNDLYTATITPLQGWVGPSTICARTIWTNGQTNQIFFSIELHRLNGDPAALQTFFDKVLNEEFAW